MTTDTVVFQATPIVAALSEAVDHFDAAIAVLETRTTTGLNLDVAGCLATRILVSRVLELAERVEHGTLLEHPDFVIPLEGAEHVLAMGAAGSKNNRYNYPGLILAGCCLVRDSLVSARHVAQKVLAESIEEEGACHA